MFGLFNSSLQCCLTVRTRIKASSRTLGLKRRNDALRPAREEEEEEETRGGIFPPVLGGRESPPLPPRPKKKKRLAGGSTDSKVADSPVAGAGIQ